MDGSVYANYASCYCTLVGESLEYKASENSIAYSISGALRTG